jgi:hypothetical protein
MIIELKWKAHNQGRIVNLLVILAMGWLVL